MSEALRRTLRDIYDKYEQRDLNAVLEAFDDKAEFTSFAPVDVFPFLGHRSGKAAIAEALTAIGKDYELVSYAPTFVVAQDEQAAGLVSARFRQRSTGRLIQVTLAHFIRFRNGRIVEFLEFMDTFNAVEQVLGREIELGQA